MIREGRVSPLWFALIAHRVYLCIIKGDGSWLSASFLVTAADTVHGGESHLTEIHRRDQMGTTLPPQLYPCISNDLY